MFRFTINDKSINQDVKRLGDRTLALWQGTAAGGSFHAATYTYTTLNGQGKPNFYKFQKHDNERHNWHYVYFGYSHVEREAFAYFKMSTSQKTLKFDNVNHYMAERFFLLLGKDGVHPNYNGFMGHLQVNLGKGAYRNTGDYKHDDDVFGFEGGMTDFFNRRPPPLVIKPDDKIYA
jgi:hypothetical protein